VERKYNRRSRAKQIDLDGKTKSDWAKESCGGGIRNLVKEGPAVLGVIKVYGAGPR